jgi:Na+/H+ antiporter NhaC
LRYALPAAAIAITVFGIFGGAQGGATVTLDISPDAAGLTMLLVPALVLTLLVRRSHLVTGLIAGIVTAAVLGMVLGRFGVGDLIGIDRDNFIATGLILDGMRRAIGVSVFTILLMGLVGGVEAAGLLDRLITWIRQKAAQAQQAEWWIFGSVTAATVLTTHSTVAILTVGELAKDVGEAAGIGAYRRANILDVVVCTYPFLLPFFIPVVLAASLTSGAGDMPRLSPWNVGVHNVHSWALLVVIIVAIATGWGRRDSKEPVTPE